MERLNKGELFVVKNDNFSNRFPDIYINTESINRKWAERAVEWYLREKGILKSQPRFSWNKIKGKNFLIPVTIGGYE